MDVASFVHTTLPARVVFGAGADCAVAVGGVGAPTSLRQIGLRAADLDRAAELASTRARRNPRPIERHALRELLQRAFDGAAPSAP